MEDNKPKIIEADGLKWFVRPDSKIGKCTQDMLGPNQREQYNFDVLKKHSGENKVFVDVGANVGGFAIRMAEHYGKVIAFEPNSYNFKALEENIKLNDTKGLQAWMLAVGDENKMVDISIRGGGSRISEEGAKHGNIKYTKVKCIRLDEFSIDKVDVMKIDTEGYEEQVLIGAKEIIERDKPVLILETHEKTYHGDPLCVGQINRLQKMLCEWGYKIEVLFKTQYGDKHLYAYQEKDGTQNA